MYQEFATDFTLHPLTTPAKRRDFVTLGNCCGAVCRALPYRNRKGDRDKLRVAIKQALAVLKIRRVDVSFTETDGRTCVHLYLYNVDQIDKARYAMTRVGFDSVSALGHYALNADLTEQGFSL